MKKAVDTGLLFSFDELRVLLFAAGIREIEGVYMPEKILEREEIIRSFHRMAERHIIRAEGSGFAVREDVKTALRIMRTPEETYIFAPCGQEGEGPEFFCYVSAEGAVVSEMYQMRKDTIKLRIFTDGTFESWKERMRDDHCGC